MSKPASSTATASFSTTSWRQSPSATTTHAHSPEELKQHGLQHLRDSVALLQSKATPEEVDEYRRFIVTLSQHVAAAHREHGQDVSEAEQAAINDITEALNAPAG